MRNKGFIVSIVFVVCSVFLLCCCGYAQNEGKTVVPTQKANPAMDVSKCMKEFDVEKADLTNPSIKGILPYLSGYFLCRAAQGDDQQLCDRLSADQASCKECNSDFNEFYGFHGRVLINKQMTGKALSACLSKDNSEQSCRALADGLVTQDVSKCGNLPAQIKEGCQDMVRGTGKFSRIAFINAIRSGSVSGCDSIKGKGAQWLCKGALNKSRNFCESSEDFKTFRKKYCEAMVKQ